MLADLIESGEQELSYIDSVKDSLMRAETENEIASIRNELVLGGFIKKHKIVKQKQPRELPPLEYVTSEGFRVLVGRNNLQNDKLTFKTAKIMICGFTPKVFRVHIQYLFPINENLQTLQFRRLRL